MIKTLLVDDEPFILDILKHTIPWQQYNIEITNCATNGKLALDLFNKEKFDLVITDIKMPHMNGIELIQTLHSMNEQVNFIIISSYDDFSLVRKSFKYGALDYILKIDIDNLDIIHPILENIRIKLSQKVLPTENYLNPIAFYNITYNDQPFCSDISNICSITHKKSKLLDFIKSLDFKNIRSLYSDFLITLKEATVLPHIFFQESYNLLSFLHNTLISYGFEASTLPRIPAYSLDTLKQFNSYNSLSMYLLNFLNALLTDITQPSNYNLHTLLTCYISTNYTNPDLTLDLIAHHLHIDKKLLSKTCSHSTGLHFKAYLNQVRIEHAKHLLLNTPLKINEVGYTVGYSNIEHFCRVFSKTVGISPSTFQSNYYHFTKTYT